MAINLEQINAQVRSLEDNAYDLTVVERALSSYRDLLNSSWQCAIMTDINSAVESYLSQIHSAEYNLQELCSEIRTVAAELYEEELRREQELQEVIK